MNFLVAIFFHWPAILLTVILAIIGLLRNDYCFLVASGYASYRSREMITWLFAIPFFLAIILLLLAVLAGSP